MTSQRSSPTRASKQSDPKDKGEALHTMKKDKERQAELRRKRGEDALRFNNIPGMKENFFEWKQNKNFNEEKFYASRGTTQKHQKATGPLRSRPCLEKVKVRAIQVYCSSKAIKMAYFDDDNAEATDYLAKLENMNNYYTWITSLIAASTLAWATEGGQIFKSDLNIQIKHWLGFVYFRSTLSKNYNEIPIAQAILIACIMAGVHINTRDIIEIEIRDQTQ
ncbi:hypothetical protein HAX54_027589, partial [Datura stramonium]|nr:hypothetical protein [Datura stramonium]